MTCHKAWDGINRKGCVFMNDEKLLSLFTREEIERIQNDDVFWWRVNEMGLLEEFNALFALLLLEQGGAES